MLYRNIKTGIEFESKSAITSPNVIAVGSAANPTYKTQEPIKAPETPKEEPKKAAVSKTTPKSKTKRTKK